MIAGNWTRLTALSGLALGLALGLGAAAPPPPSPAVDACRMDPGDAAWLAGALQAWELTRFKTLKLDQGDPPTLVLFDKTCVWRGKLGKADLASAPHQGMIPLPGGGQVPAAVTSFAAPNPKDKSAFLVMALPTVWRDGGVTSTLGLEALMTSVFVHETTHTRQFYAFEPRMRTLTRRWKLPDDIDDNAVQARFGADGYYLKAYQTERDLLYRAAAETDIVKARDLARQALGAVRTRRSHFFTGVDRKYLDVEDAFLTLEGIGNLAAYSWLVDPQGGAREPAQAMTDFRRGGRYWSQDEGLAILLVVDHLVPDWRARAFAPRRPATALELLAVAAGA